MAIEQLYDQVVGVGDLNNLVFYCDDLLDSAMAMFLSQQQTTILVAMLLWMCLNLSLLTLSTARDCFSTSHACVMSVIRILWNLNRTQTFFLPQSF
ncbi:MAG: hypothetical protein CL912_14360 [Deltaproteobacteria bacterium]|nr:hypothetical protein [Deltaproteobacteria bacterium]